MRFNEERTLLELAETSYVREHLMQGGKSDLAKYQQAVTAKPGLSALLKYELLTSVFGSVPGAMGLFLRRHLYRTLFGDVGRGCVIGRNVVIRHPERIWLGSRVVIDDQCVLDARGSGAEGVHVGDGTVIGRGCTVQAKYGPIEIGTETSIGASTLVCSMGRVTIGSSVLIAGGCYISGGMYHCDRTDVPIAQQGIYTRGPVSVGDGSWIGMGAIILDGVTIGKGCVIGAGSVVTKDVPDYAVALGVPAKVSGIRRQDREFAQNV